MIFDLTYRVKTIIASELLIPADHRYPVGLCTPNERQNLQYDIIHNPVLTNAILTDANANVTSLYTCNHIGCTGCLPQEDT
jgi:hypothetical protein